MPELPETETIARDLNSEVQGAVITKARVLRADILREISARSFVGNVKGMRIERVWRRAKNIVLDLASANTDADHHTSKFLVVQPRFTGGLLIADSTTPEPELRYSTVQLSLEDGRTIHYRDVRRLGTVSLFNPTRFKELNAALGPEPLDDANSVESLAASIRKSKRPIKAVIMDQRRIAGVGNIYANEALWSAGIDPSRKAAELTDEEAFRLIRELQRILRASIHARGTSFRDYRDAHGKRGTYVRHLKAYGREGEDCSRCGHQLVATHEIDGRSTVFCAWCQH